MTREWNIRAPNVDEKECAWCEKKFTPNHGREKYCSLDCRKKKQKKNQKKYGDKVAAKPENIGRSISHIQGGAEPFQLLSENLKIGPLGKVDDPYEFIESLGLDDGTEEVRELLRRQVVYAHNVCHDLCNGNHWDTIPLLVLERTVELTPVRYKFLREQLIKQADTRLQGVSALHVTRVRSWANSLPPEADLNPRLLTARSVQEAKQMEGDE